LTNISNLYYRVDITSFSGITPTSGNMYAIISAGNSLFGSSDVSTATHTVVMINTDSDYIAVSEPGVDKRLKIVGYIVSSLSTNTCDTLLSFKAGTEVNSPILHYVSVKPGETHYFNLYGAEITLNTNSAVVLKQSFGGVNTPILYVTIITKAENI